MKKIICLLLIILETISIPILALMFSNYLQENYTYFENTMFTNNKENGLLVLVLLASSCCYFLINVLSIRNNKSHLTLIAIYIATFTTLPHLSLYQAFFFKHNLLLLISVLCLGTPLTLFYTSALIKVFRYPKMRTFIQVIKDGARTSI
jgi:hypothetical protein